MQPTPLEKASALSLSVTGNLFLLGIFLYALFFPSRSEEFIFQTSLFLFIMEFLSVHSGAMLGGQKASKQRSPFFSKIFFLALYSLFAFATGAGFKNFAIPAFFFVSLSTKVFGNKATQNPHAFFIPVLILMATLGISFWTAPTWQSIFPLPSDLAQKVPPNSSGLEGRQMAFVLWGVLYFSLSILVEILMFTEKGRKFFEKIFSKVTSATG